MTKERTRRRVLAVLAIAVAGGALVFLAVGGIGENLVYYWSPHELVEAGPKAIGATIRLGGVVAPGSILHDADGAGLRFEITDGEATVPVVAHSVPPSMFRENIGVVLEGTMLRDGTFETRRLMVKHDNEYRIPEGTDMDDMKEMMKTMQFEDQGE
ncbi:MAG: cytochrome c maturation protein CcmE [bacterium]|nr:cytochrome c maturation protein CcmE [bacterium]